MEKRSILATKEEAGNSQAGWSVEASENVKEHLRAGQRYEMEFETKIGSCISQAVSPTIPEPEIVLLVVDRKGTQMRVRCPYDRTGLEPSDDLWMNM